jgi:hypothetical protein
MAVRIGSLRTSDDPSDPAVVDVARGFVAPAQSRTARSCPSGTTSIGAFIVDGETALQGGIARPGLAVVIKGEHVMQLREVLK